METKSISNFGKGKTLASLVSAWVALALPVSAANYYVSPTGNNSNAGSKDQPFATIAKGQTAAVAGDTVFFRGGDYKFVSSSDEIGITLNKSGSSGKLIHYLAYPGEAPVFDFYGMTAQKRIKGVLVTGNWLHLKGIEMKGVPQSAALKAHEDWCVYVNGGSNNIFENLNIHHNMGPGFFIQDGGNNYILNCDSHDNYDANSYTDGVLNPGENADGFGVHVKSGSSTGNHFYGCRSWFNADDGWDFISCLASVTVENCWAWGNGYKTGTTPPQSAGNGNGFKVGGFGATADGAPNPAPQHTVRFCLAFNNKAAGFYQNHHPISNFYYNNTSYNNKSANFNLLGYKGGDASLGIFRNNIAFMGTALSNDKTGNGVDAVNNTWNLSISVTAGDFQSTDTAGVGGPRQADGSLPNLAFMKLKASSGLIDKGININLPYNGTAPDMGGFEYGTSTNVKTLHQSSRMGNSHRVLRLQSDGYDLSGRFQSLAKPTPQLLIQPL
jgi:hypothetical protein